MSTSGRPASLRTVLGLLDQSFRCSSCGGSIMMRATSWNHRHGVGVRGVSTSEARSFEAATPEQHCICPGGPVWALLAARAIGRAWKLEEARRFWEQQGKPTDRVFLVQSDPEHPSKLAWFEMALDDWRTMLRETWAHLLASNGE